MKPIRLLIIAIVSCQIASGQINIVRETGSSDPVFAKLDEFLVSYMKQFNMKAGAIAVAKDGRIVHAKAITHADRSYPLTYPTSLFRIASLSKPITAMAIHKLARDTPFTLDTLVQNILKISLPKQDDKPKNLTTEGYYFDKVTVRNLLTHRGGWPRNFATLFNDQVVANKYNNGKLPVSKTQVALWGAQQKQKVYPGIENNYSNYGFLLLGLVIEKLRGESYITAVRNMFLRNMNITRPRQSLAKKSERQPGEVLYHVIPEQEVPCMISTGNCPIQYGGENNYNFDSFGGWLFSPVDYVKFFSEFRKKNKVLPDMSYSAILSIPENYSISTKGVVYEHGGDIPGGWAYMACRKDGVDFMFAVNTTTDPEKTFTYDNKSYTAGQHPLIWHKLLDEIETWPSYDLSPAFFGNDKQNKLSEGLQYALVWNANNNDAVMERALDKTAFSSTNSMMEKRGYRLKATVTSVQKGIVLRDGIWNRSIQPQLSVTDKTQDELHQLYSTNYQKGFRLTHLEGYSANNEVRYNAVWGPSTNDQFVSWAKSLDEIQSLDLQMTAKGFQMVHQQMYRHLGKYLYNAIWNKTSQKYYRVNRKTFAEIRKLYSDNFKKSLRLTQLQAYDFNGTIVYDCIWEPGSYPQVFAWDLYNEQADAETIINKSKKFSVALLSAY